MDGPFAASVPRGKLRSLVKPVELVEAESGMAVTGGCAGDGLGKERCWSKGDSFSYKMDKFWRSNVRQCDYSEQYSIV